MDTSIVVALISTAGLLMEARILSGQRANEKHRRDSEKRLEMLMEGLEAALVAVRQLGANGRVSSALRALEHYKNEKSAS